MTIDVRVDPRQNQENASLTPSTNKGKFNGREVLRWVGVGILSTLAITAATIAMAAIAALIIAAVAAGPVAAFIFLGWEAGTIITVVALALFAAPVVVPFALLGMGVGH